MNFKSISIALTMAGGIAFGFFVSLDRLVEALTPLITIQTIMAAAIFVRLNRGMPTIDWKNVPATRRSALTTAIVDVTKEYAILVAVIAMTLTYLIALLLAGPISLCLIDPPHLLPFVVGLSGALIGLSIARMIYVIWRDVDIVILQKAIIDEAGALELQESERQAAATKIEAMKASGIQKQDQPPTVPWESK